MSRPAMRCDRCPVFPIADGEFVARKPCPLSKRNVARATPACDAGRARLLFLGRSRRGNE